MYQLEILTKNLTKGDENENRIFEAYVSVEIIDRQNDLVKIDGLAKTMETWLNVRGAPITDSHTNRVVGKGLKYEIRKVKEKLAIWLEAKIFKNYKVDDDVWEKIKKGTYAGVSIGGHTFSKYRQCDTHGKNCYNVIPDLEVFEVAVVDKAANQLADIIAKQQEGENKMSEDNEKKEVIKEEATDKSQDLHIYLHQESKVQKNEDIINLEDLDLGSSEYESVMKADDFCQCDDHGLDSFNKSTYEEEVNNLSESVDSLLNKQLLDIVAKLTTQVERLTDKVGKIEHDKPDPKAPKEDEEEDEEEEKPKPKSKPKEEDEEKPDDEKKEGKKVPQKVKDKWEEMNEDKEKPKEAKKNLKKAITPDPNSPTESAYTGKEVNKAMGDVQKMVSEGRMSQADFEVELAKIRKARFV